MAAERARRPEGSSGAQKDWGRFEILCEIQDNIPQGRSRVEVSEYYGQASDEMSSKGHNPCRWRATWPDLDQSNENHPSTLADAFISPKLCAHERRKSKDFLKALLRAISTPEATLLSGPPPSFFNEEATTTKVRAQAVAHRYPVFYYHTLPLDKAEAPEIWRATHEKGKRMSNVLRYQETFGLAERKATWFHTIRWRVGLQRVSDLTNTRAEALCKSLRDGRRRYLQRCARYADFLTTEKRRSCASSNNGKHDLSSTSQTNPRQAAAEGGERDKGGGKVSEDPQEITAQVKEPPRMIASDGKGVSSSGIARYRSEELELALETIRADVERTYQTVDVFRQQGTQQMLIRILAVWSLEHPAIGYRQALSQILAIIFIALQKDFQSLAQLRHRWQQSDLSAARGPEESEREEEEFENYPNVIYDVIDPDHVEPDAYSLLESVIGALYRKYGGNEEEEEKREQRDSKDEGEGVERAMYRVHHVLLKGFDVAVYRCLERENVLPQLYLVRWVRLLFAREFRIDQVLCLWDYIMYDLELIEYLCVTLVVVMRQRLLKAERNGTLLNHLLRHATFVNWDATLLCNHARSLRDGRRWFMVAPRVPSFAKPNARFASGIWNKTISKKAYLRASRIALGTHIDQAAKQERELKHKDNTKAKKSPKSRPWPESARSREGKSEGGGGREIRHLRPGGESSAHERDSDPSRAKTSQGHGRGGEGEEDVEQRGSTLTEACQAHSLPFDEEAIRALKGSDGDDNEEGGKKSSEPTRPESLLHSGHHRSNGKPSVEIEEDETPRSLKVQGLLVKRGEGRLGSRSYKLRWFVLSKSTLCYFKNEVHWRTKLPPIRKIDLKGQRVRIIDPDRFHFSLVPSEITGRHYNLYASDQQAMNLWVSILTAVTSGTVPLDIINADQDGPPSNPKLHSRRGSFAVEAPF
eukprot:CAMPEP_0184506006 /NCGR_PEP_ID=MMETSP0113_2-20130426/53277_1 /TAXON_ID=91329 /ORGANISM="Norrisiella sphaerica, Strain BC52" /LENGTH=926 /DNA_ID=CAMNT_0026895709 /DNA_START=15 /DNA_END=2796 /DNA_ORIENTATION=+